MRNSKYKNNTQNIFWVFDCLDPLHLGSPKNEVKSDTKETYKLYFNVKRMQTNSKSAHFELWYILAPFDPVWFHLGRLKS